MSKINLSQTAVLDYRDWLLHLSCNRELDFQDCVQDKNEAFILGTYFNEWEPALSLPYKLTKHVRHVEESLAEIKPQLEYFGKKFAETQPDASYFDYCYYIFDNLLTDNEGIMKDVSLYLGLQYGKMINVGFDKSMYRTLVFARTASGPAFIGLVYTRDHQELILTQAHEFSRQGSSILDIAAKSEVSEMISFIILNDVVEIRPCTPDQLKEFVDRTKCMTYGDPNATQQ